MAPHEALQAEGAVFRGIALEPWALLPGPPAQAEPPPRACEVFRACSHAQAWVLFPAPQTHPPPGALGIFFFFLTLKESPIGEAGSEGGGSQAGIWASEGFIPGLSY